MKETVFYDVNKVKERYAGLTPEQLNDFKALKGDPSDNIPGVKGIGEKTALFLIKEFGSIENLYQDLASQPERIKKINQRLKDMLLKDKDLAILSKNLSQIKKDVPINFHLLEIKKNKCDSDGLIKIFKELEFNSLIKRLSELDKTAEAQGQHSAKETDNARELKRELPLW